jgi:hypothetical protein
LRFILEFVESEGLLLVENSDGGGVEAHLHPVPLQHELVPDLQL